MRRSDQASDARGRIWLLGALALYWVFVLGVLRCGVPDPADDTWEYGLAARQLLAGHGWRTTMIHPPLWSFHAPDGTIPLLIHGPLLPAVFAAVFRLLGERAIAWTAWGAAVSAWLAAWLTERVCRRFFGAAAAATAAIALTLSPHMLNAVTHDVAMCAGAMLLALIMDLTMRERPNAVVVGAAVGLALLVRPEFLPLAIALPFLVPALRSWWSYAAPALACVVPWAGHQYLATGIIGFNLSTALFLSYTKTWPGLAVLQDFALTPARLRSELWNARAELVSKWLFTAPRALRHVLQAPSAWTSWLAFAGAFRLLRDRPWRLAAGLVVAGMVIPFVFMTLTERNPRLLIPFLPLFAIALAAGVAWIVERRWLGISGVTAMALVTLLALASTIPACLKEWREAHALEPWLAAERAALEERGAVGEGQPLMFSDRPDFVSWITRRPVIGVSREQYLHLAKGDLRGDLPDPGLDRDTWFHREGLSPGGTAAELGY